MQAFIKTLINYIFSKCQYLKNVNLINGLNIVLIYIKLYRHFLLINTYS